jgi:hypothetical protein
MEEALRFFRTYEYVVYLVLALLAFWGIRKFAQAWEDVRAAAFGLEREAAQIRLNRAAVFLVLLLVAGVAEFTLVYFVAPAFPGANPLLTPTLDLLATATYTLSPQGSAAVDPDITPTPPTPTPVGEGCLTGALEITQPVNGSTISDQVTLIGSVDLPNLAFYTYEVARPGETVWLPIQAGRGVKQDEALGDWFTSTLPPGEYVLRLVATDNEGNELGICQIRVFVAPPSQ